MSDVQKSIAAMLQVNDVVYFKAFDVPYVVYAKNEQYAVCRDELSKEDYYTIIDISNDLRGTHDSYGQATITRADCETTLQRLAADEIGMSSRNVVALDIKRVDKAQG